MSRIINSILSFFRTGATTVGLSPKALGAALGTVIVALVNFLLSKLGLTVQDVADWVGTSPQYITGAELLLGATIAAWLLPSGHVVTPPTAVSNVMSRTDFEPHPRPVD